MSKHICAECLYQFMYISKPKLTCMNVKSERYGEDIDGGDYCNEWEDRRASDVDEEMRHMRSRNAYNNSTIQGYVRWMALHGRGRYMYGLLRKNS